MDIIIQTPTPNLEQSLDFYRKLGFELIDLEENRYAIAKNLMITINDDRFSRAGLKLFVDQPERFIKDHNLSKICTETGEGFLVVSPEACPIYIVKKTHDLPNNVEKNAVPGNFSGFSLETNDMRGSTDFWKRIGFTKNGGNIDHGWISMINEATGFSIGLMKYQCCPHLFFNPSLNFFNGKENPNIISKIRALKIEITEEITHFNPNGEVDNIIIRDPGGLGYFIFND